MDSVLLYSFSTPPLSLRSLRKTFHSGSRGELFNSAHLTKVSRGTRDWRACVAIVKSAMAAGENWPKNALVVGQHIGQRSGGKYP
jgi:hypothetical protein